MSQFKIARQGLPNFGGQEYDMRRLLRRQMKLCAKAKEEKYDFSKKVARTRGFLHRHREESSSSVR
eukprot:3194701-Karenia_brevis.AAC.1